MRLQRVACGLIATLALLLTGVTPSYSAPQAPTSCSEAPKNLGAKLPVVLVPGLWSSGSSWGDTSKPKSMYAQLNKLPGVYVEAFDYTKTNTQWVTADNNGPRLAKRIACLASASRANGGPGKVFGVGHSMGGLNLEYAANQTVNGRAVSDDLIEVNTIGTPYEGSYGGNAMKAVLKALCSPVTQAGNRSTGFAVSHSSICEYKDGYTAFDGLVKFSGKIKALPGFPKNLPVQAIAGDVTLQTLLFKSVMDWNTQSDLVVQTSSAFKGDTYRKTGMTRSCRSLNPVSNGVAIALIEGAPDCWHSALTSQPAVIDQVIKNVSTYTSRTITAGYLQFKAPASWNTGGVYSLKNDGLTGVRTGGCVTTNPQDCRGFEVRTIGALNQGAGPSYFYYGSTEWQQSGGPAFMPGHVAKGVLCETATKVKDVQTTIGGSATVYTEWRVPCGTQSFTERTWWNKRHQTLVVDYYNTSGLWDALRDATWTVNQTPFNDYNDLWHGLNFSASISGDYAIVSWSEPGNTVQHIVDGTLFQRGSKVYFKPFSSESGPNDGYGNVSFVKDKLYGLTLDTGANNTPNGMLGIIGIAGLCASVNHDQCGGF
jgi:hypothetical protein